MARRAAWPSGGVGGRDAPMAGGCAGSDGAPIPTERGVAVAPDGSLQVRVSGAGHSRRRVGGRWHRAVAEAGAGVWRRAVAEGADGAEGGVAVRWRGRGCRRSVVEGADGAEGGVAVRWSRRARRADGGRLRGL
jgi:hypothetical protein